MSTTKRRTLACAMAALLSAEGCTTPKASPPVPPEQGGLAFVRDGQTTREEALLKLGEPTGQFEGGRILTWRLWADEKGQVTPFAPRRSASTGLTTAASCQHSLVLVLDARNVVARHSVVPMK